MPDTQKFLDNAGVQTLWNCIKAKFVEQEAGKGLSTNDFTDALQTKLNGIESGAQVNQNAFSTITVGSTNITASSTTDTVKFTAGDNVTLTPTANTKTIAIAAQDTTYDVASASADGLMSSSDFSKLAGIDAGAEENVIEIVKVNNSALTVTNKAVNIAIAQGSTNGTISVNSSDVAVKGLDTAAYAKTESTLTTSGNNLPTGSAVAAYVTGLGYQTAADVSAAISTAVSQVYKYKGSVASQTQLPSSGQSVGDVYNIETASDFGPAGMNVAWNGTAWDALGSSVAVEAMTASEIQAICV